MSEGTQKVPQNQGITVRMGVGQSSSQVSLAQAQLASLATADYDDNSAFWDTFLSSAPARSLCGLPDALSLRHVAAAEPHNFLTLAVTAVRRVKALQAEATRAPPSDAALNELAWALSIFTVATELLAATPALHSLLATVDPILAAAVIVAPPKKPKRAKSPAPKSPATTPNQKPSPRSASVAPKPQPGEATAPKDAPPKPKAKKASQSHPPVETSAAPKPNVKKAKPADGTPKAAEEPPKAADPPPAKAKPKKTKAGPEEPPVVLPGPSPKLKAKAKKPSEPADVAPSTKPTEPPEPDPPAKPKPKAKRAKVVDTPPKPDSASLPTPKSKERADSVPPAKPKAKLKKASERADAAPSAKPTEAPAPDPAAKPKPKAKRAKVVDAPPKPDSPSLPVPKSKEPAESEPPAKPKGKAKKAPQPADGGPNAAQKAPAESDPPAKPKAKKAGAPETAPTPDPAPATKPKAKPKKTPDTPTKPDAAVPAGDSEPPPKPKAKAKKARDAPPQPVSVAPPTDSPPAPKQKPKAKKAAAPEPPSEPPDPDIATKKAKKPKAADSAPSTPAAASHGGKASRAQLGSLVSTFVASVTTLLFRRHVTLEPKDTRWSDAPRLDRTRRDLVHSLLGVVSLPYFVPPANARADFEIPLPDFPYVRFIESVCIVSATYLQQLRTGAASPVVVDLLSNSFTLATRLFSRSDFRSLFASVNKELLLKAFSVSPAAIPIFGPYSTIGSESISFLYISVLLHPEFVQLLSDDGYSNQFLYHLIFTAELTFERLEFCYLHSVLLSTILLIVSNPVAAAALNEDCPQVFNCSFRPSFRSFADLLLEVLINMCGKEDFWPSIACILHTVAPFLAAVSFPTAVKVVALFEQVVAAQNGVTPLFLEAFASIVQRKQVPENGFLVAIYQKGKVFGAVQAGNARAARALDKIGAFLALARAGKKKGLIISDALGKRLASLDVSQIVQENFGRRPHLAGGEIEKTWSNWVDLLFVKAFQQEVQQLQVGQGK